MARKNNSVDKTGIRNRGKSAGTRLVGAMGWATVVFTGFSGHGWAVDYGSTGTWNNQSGSGYQSDYATRWARDTKPWSREFSGDASEFGGADAGYATGYNQWEGESSGGRQDWRDPQASYGNNSTWQSRSWYENQPNNVSQRPEPDWESRTQRANPNRQVSGPQQDDWGELREPAPRPIPGRQEDDPWSGNQPRSGNRNNGLKRPSGTRRTTSWDDRSQSADSRPPRDYSTRGTLSLMQNSWEKDPWSRNPSENPRSGSQAYPSNANSYGGQTAWGRERSDYQNNPSQEGRPWGTSRRRGKAPSQQQPKSTPYAPLPDAGQSGYPEYPGHPGYSGYAVPYSGMGDYGAAYSPGYGYGREIHGPESTYGAGGAYPGLGNVPTVGDLLGFPF
uniref:Uncharacterized protein n=1 Tax=Candidatus Kentrum sp. DK TaxID=2126562 RepID=A0A450T9Z3_9GAMM|nr:MAG: hypothetical protein BECKDK2373C_GA0170839_11085 [Candidatus Kentron sp. DK]